MPYERDDGARLGEDDSGYYDKNCRWVENTHEGLTGSLVKFATSKTVTKILGNAEH
ncbi:hypothetical protein LTR66_015047, partial [Elasticomyces elasticus]